MNDEFRTTKARGGSELGMGLAEGGRVRHFLVAPRKVR